METKELIEKSFRQKFPDERYVIKTISTIKDVFGDENNDSYVVEFIDNRVKHTKRMELILKKEELNKE